MRGVYNQTNNKQTTIQKLSNMNLTGLRTILILCTFAMNVFGLFPPRKYGYDMQRDHFSHLNYGHGYGYGHGHAYGGYDMRRDYLSPFKYGSIFDDYIWGRYRVFPHRAYATKSATETDKTEEKNSTTTTSILN